MADKDTPGVIAPPPLIFLSFLIAGFALGVAWPWTVRSPVFEAQAGWAGWVFVGLGLVVFVLGVRNFIRAGTPVPTREETRSLVTSGIHGLSRNPIYVAMFLLYLGIALLANAAWLLVLYVPLALVMRYGVVAREEAYLARKFGEAYEAYRARVPRWL
jgi:protein-S-isoprenylcysteine O-methyltransferase Ste14